MSDFEKEVLLSTSAKYYILESAPKKRAFSAHPINVDREIFGEFHHLYTQLKQHPPKFKEYMRMTVETFDYVLSHISDRSEKDWRNCHTRPIVPEERLMITIR